MSIYQTELLAGPLALPGLRHEPVYAPTGLDSIYASAPRIPFDDDSRLVFLSDCHRGDGSRADAFAPNEPLYLAALERYRRRGYTYVEVGDGDDLWLNRRLADVRAAHPRVFELLHDFGLDGKLHLIRGNHETGGHQYTDKDGLATHDGLVLTHTISHQHVFVVHGHQLDLPNATFGTVTRFWVRNVWAHIARSRAGGAFRPSGNNELPSGAVGAALRWIQAQRRHVAQGLAEWAQAQRITTICAHTHRPACAAYGQAPYFNTGSCVAPGYITGIELERGVISLVKWTLSTLGGSGTLRAERQLLAAPRALCLFP